MVVWLAFDDRPTDRGGDFAVRGAWHWNPQLVVRDSVPRLQEVEFLSRLKAPRHSYMAMARLLSRNRLDNDDEVHFARSR